MGNIIIIISWFPTTFDSEIKRQLTYLAIGYGFSLQDDIPYSQYNYSKSQYGVKIPSVKARIWQNYYSKKIDNFKDECTKLLDNMNVYAVEISVVYT